MVVTLTIWIVITYVIDKLKIRSDDYDPKQLKKYIYIYSSSFIASSQSIQNNKTNEI